MAILKQFRLLMIFSFVLFLSGCLYFDYGVDKQEIELPYRTYYYSDRNKRWDFHTVLYSREGNPAGKYNYTDFVIRIAHLYQETHQSKAKGYYVSKIDFSDFTVVDNIEIDADSIKLVHKDAQGEIIPFIRTEHDLDRKPKTKYRNHYYRKIYSPEVLPDTITEYVYVAFSVDGKKEIIEYEFPVKKKLHYTLWDVMMGI